MDAVLIAYRDQKVQEFINATERGQNYEQIKKVFCELVDTVIVDLTIHLNRKN